ncbi:TorD/DmsD family molecular chaperone [Rhodobium gokarnense]|uniref:TorA-specific chaperone n=1 Tax=Rhodobium gokarnense TaxID=364296 RepID=A0ABT3H6T7_9HYPH|nr:molecular chaperone TorD family protein [Rhodobium gokarnense]MCW2306108.1 TorA-specific chaperone [Rhodobium gokarnense]
MPTESLDKAAAAVPDPAFYQWLAGLFIREQTEETLAVLKAPETRTEFHDLAAGNDVLRGRLNRLIDVAANPADPQDQVLDLASAYARLFLGAGGSREGVPPYESVYTGADGRLYQEATAEMEALLKEQGLWLADRREPADHIAVELELLAQLTARAADDADAAARRRTLLGDHLLVWAWEFCDLCRDRDRSGFYAAAAEVLRTLLEAEERALKAH